MGSRGKKRGEVFCEAKVGERGGVAFLPKGPGGCIKHGAFWDFYHEMAASAQRCYNQPGPSLQHFGTGFREGLLTRHISWWATVLSTPAQGPTHTASLRHSHGPVTFYTSVAMLNTHTHTQSSSWEKVPEIPNLMVQRDLILVPYFLV